MIERVSGEELRAKLDIHKPFGLEPPCNCDYCLLRRDLLDSRARVKELEEALRDLIPVAEGRGQSVEAAQRALRGEKGAGR
jgi:hypothetical protein